MYAQVSEKHKHTHYLELIDPTKGIYQLQVVCVLDVRYIHHRHPPDQPHCPHPDAHTSTHTYIHTYAESPWGDYPDCMSEVCVCVSVKRGLPYGKRDILNAQKRPTNVLAYLRYTDRLSRPLLS